MDTCVRSSEGEIANNYSLLFLCSIFKSSSIHVHFFARGCVANDDDDDDGRECVSNSEGSSAWSFWRSNGRTPTGYLLLLSFMIFP